MNVHIHFVFECYLFVKVPTMFVQYIYLDRKIYFSFKVIPLLDWGEISNMLSAVEMLFTEEVLFYEIL